MRKHNPLADMLRSPFRTLPLIALLIAGCAAPVKPTVAPLLPPPAITVSAEELFLRGEYEAAATQFLNQARSSTGEQLFVYHLSAAEALVRADRYEQAQTILNELDVSLYNPALQFHTALLEAEIALWRQEAQMALDLLDAPLTQAISVPLRYRFHYLRAEAYQRVGNHLESANERIQLEPLITESEESETNHEQILAALNRLTAQVLEQLITTADDVLAGWMELTRIIKLYAPATPEFEQAIGGWYRTHPGHPAADQFIATLSQQLRDTALEVNQIALLLPLSGPYAAPAAAIRDGFMAAYYRTPIEERPQLQIYDVSGEPHATWSIYLRAVSEGADLVIGPLRKESVQIFAEAAQLPVPILALNYAANETSVPDNLYQFGLAPEGEATQIAERAWLDGHSKAVAIVPKGAWGERVLAAFRNHWQDLGGSLLEAHTYDSKKSDFSRPIRKMLNIDDSYRRLNGLNALLGGKVKFEPRRRQDIDMIFMAGFPRQARLLRPQFKFHYAADLPVYSTSHIFSGMYERSKDRDMDGVLFCDMPWILSKDVQKSTISRDIKQLWPDQQRRFGRLYAMGYDAFHAPPYLEWLRKHPAQRYEGMTGSLHISRANRLERVLGCSRFRRGNPRPAAYTQLEATAESVAIRWPSIPAQEVAPFELTPAPNSWPDNL